MGFRVQVKGEMVPDQDSVADARLLWRFRLVDDDATVVDESPAMWDSEQDARSAGESARLAREEAESGQPVALPTAT